MTSKPLRTAVAILPLVLLPLGCDSSDSLSGVPGTLAIEVQPAGPAPNASPFAVQPVVRLVDAAGAPLQVRGTLIQAALSGDPLDSVWLSNARAYTDDSGRAHFYGLAVGGSEGTFRISFSAEGFDPATSGSVEVSAPLEGTTFDPYRDMQRHGADIVSSVLRVIDGDSLFLALTWAPGEFIRDTSNASVRLDTDQDPSTGNPGINSTGSVDPEWIGWDYRLMVSGNGEHTQVSLSEANGLLPDGTYCGRSIPCNCSWVILPDGVEVTLPLSDLGPAEEGRMNYKVVTFVKVEVEGAYSGWLDVVPDVSSPPAQAAGGGTQD